VSKGRKSWQEKLHENHGLPCVEPMPPKMVRTLGSGSICVPSPIEVDEIMRVVPRGRLITVNHIRAVMATRHGATVG
jgi:hypothetical protein